MQPSISIRNNNNRGSAEIVFNQSVNRKENGLCYIYIGRDVKETRRRCHFLVGRKSHSSKHHQWPIINLRGCTGISDKAATKMDGFQTFYRGEAGKELLLYMCSCGCCEHCALSTVYIFICESAYPIYQIPRKKKPTGIIQFRLIFSTVFFSFFFLYKLELQSRVHDRSS